MNVCFETFGCRLNRAEALEDEAKCLANGHKIVKEHGKADLIVVRGCSVTARAQRDCEHQIAHLKRKYPNKRLIVTGCLPGSQKKIAGFESRSSNSSPQPTTHDPQPVPTRTARAYLKVQDGCGGNCTFCIVPKFRGTAISEPFGATVDKAKRFIEAGYHEIVVTGCNLSLYASEGKRLPDLLAALAGLSPDCRIRLGSLEPWGCAEEVVDAMAEHANICRFLHLPVQSGSDRILKLMGRPYAVEDVERIARKAQVLMPFVSLGCDLMTGFPGESEGDFMLTRKLLADLGFSNAHVFPYSERPGTPAAKMRGVIPKDVRSDRAHILGNIAKLNRQRFARRFIGKEVEIVVESHGQQPQGWTSEYLWFKGPVRQATGVTKTFHRKQLMRFVVRSADKGILHGVSIGNGR